MILQLITNNRSIRCDHFTLADLYAWMFLTLLWFCFVCFMNSLIRPGFLNADMENSKPPTSDLTLFRCSVELPIKRHLIQSKLHYWDSLLSKQSSNGVSTSNLVILAHYYWSAMSMVFFVEISKQQWCVVFLLKSW